MNKMINNLKAQGIISAILMMGISFVLPANAASTPNLQTIYQDGDYFYNHDFLSQNPMSWNVDWPVTMVYCQNSNINKIKSLYWGPTVSDTMYLQMKDNGVSWIWDSDMGTKNGFFYSAYLGQTVKLHMRLYAPNPPDYLTNTSWNKYVLGTTHYDEFWTESWSGYSEWAEKDVSSIAAGYGYVVIPDTVYTANYDYRGNISNHIWQNNGYATRVCVP